MLPQQKSASYDSSHPVKGPWDEPTQVSDNSSSSLAVASVEQRDKQHRGQKAPFFLSLHLCPLSINSQQDPEKQALLLLPLLLPSQVT